MNISESQVRDVAEATTKRFERQLAAHLRSMFPQKLAPLDDERLQSAVCACISKAAQYGIEVQEDIRRFAEFAVSYGLSMDQQESVAWIGSVLRMNERSGTERMDLLDVIEARFVGDTT